MLVNVEFTMNKTHSCAIECIDQISYWLVGNLAIMIGIGLLEKLHLVFNIPVCTIDIWSKNYSIMDN